MKEKKKKMEAQIFLKLYVTHYCYTTLTLIGSTIVSTWKKAKKHQKPFFLVASWQKHVLHFFSDGVVI